MSNQFTFPFRVYIEDTDAGGIVYYVNYLKYMERARTELFRFLGFTKPAMIASDLLLVVASVEVNYRKSAKLDDKLDVSASVKKLAKAYISLEQNVYRGEECLCEGRLKIACVTRQDMRPAVIPEKVRVAFERYINDSVLGE